MHFRLCSFSLLHVFATSRPFNIVFADKGFHFISDFIVYSEIILIFAAEINYGYNMNATIDISYNQMMLLLQQMPVRSQLRIGKALTRQNIRAELNHFLETFRTDELSETDIMAEVKAVRRKRYAKKA